MSEDSLFCEFCGVKIKKESHKTSERNKLVKQDTRNNSFRILTISLWVIAIIICVFVANSYLFENQNNEVLNTPKETGTDNTPAQTKQDLPSIEAKIETYNKMLDVKQAEQKTLANEMDTIDYQIKITELEIEKLKLEGADSEKINEKQSYLDGEQKSKEKLIEDTHGDENRYQELLKKVEEEKQTLLGDIEEMQQINYNRPARFQTTEAKAVESALPNTAFLRDFVSIPNSKGTLALYVESPYILGKFPGNDTNGDGTIDEPSFTCPDNDYGQQLEGQYQLGLIRDGKLINSVPLPKGDYDPNYPIFRQFRGIINNSWYDKEHPTAFDKDIIEPQLLNLKDLTGDGLAYEVSFRVGYYTCGNNDYTVGGYDNRKDRAVFYLITSGDTSSYTHMNFSPNSDGSVYVRSGCDHGATEETWSKYMFNEKEGGYIMKKFLRNVSCEKYGTKEYSTELDAWMKN